MSVAPVEGLLRTFGPFVVPVALFALGLGGFLLVGPLGAVGLLGR